MCFHLPSFDSRHRSALDIHGEEHSIKCNTFLRVATDPLSLKFNSYDVNNDHHNIKCNTFPSVVTNPLSLKFNYDDVSSDHGVQYLGHYEYYRIS